MKLLFLSKYHPSYFSYYASCMAQKGHEVVVLSEYQRKDSRLPNVRHMTVRFVSVMPPVVDAERAMLSYLRRGAAFGTAMRKLRSQGFTPDHIYVETTSACGLHCTQVYPRVPKTAAFEWFFGLGEDYRQAREKKQNPVASFTPLQIRNMFQLDMLEQCSTALVRTEWQKHSFPPDFLPKIRVLFEGVDTNWFAPCAARLPLPPDTKLITYISRELPSSRDFEMFLKALPLVLTRHPESHILLVGKDSGTDAESNVKAALFAGNALAIDPSRVHWVSACSNEEYRAALCTSHVHVFTLNGPVIGVSLFEALSCGCLVLAPAQRAAQEIVQHEVNGLITPFTDERQLAEALHHALINNHDELRANARLRSLALYDRHKAVQELEAALSR